MESASPSLRILVILGKYRVTKVEKGVFGTKFRMDMGNSVFVDADLGVSADVRVGDLLTIYTEVLADDKSSTTPIQ